ncbi:MAG: hypothetical protein HRU12_15410 [Phaeodactylibacter sp.]|nr:hypothetical protein [Cyclobacteriaceae bacterium HetDA_MAG_MS6]NRA50519.1 hypothetical protein [Phaeodactylibacter sp.]
MNKLTQNAMLLFTLITLLSCNKKDHEIQVDSEYQLTTIPSIIEDQFIGKGQETQDTVIVYAEGGPEPYALATDIEVPQFDNYYRVYVKQAQYLNENIAETEITFEQAILEDQVSTDIYQNVLEHFVNQGKVVIAMSHSFGSFILTNVLATKPNIAHKYVIMAGRLDIQDVIWEGFRDGTQYSFPNNDGTTIIPDGGSILTGGELSYSRLAAGLGKNRYTELLADKDLSNLYFIGGEYDEAVGRLTEEEVQFLYSKDAQPIKIIEGDHSSMFHPDGLEFILSEIIRQ